MARRITVAQQRRDDSAGFGGDPLRQLEDEQSVGSHGTQSSVLLVGADRHQHGGAAIARGFHFLPRHVSELDLRHPDSPFMYPYRSAPQPGAQIRAGEY